MLKKVSKLGTSLSKTTQLTINGGKASSNGTYCYCLEGGGGPGVCSDCRYICGGGGGYICH